MQVPTLYLFPVPMGDTPPAQVLPAGNIAIIKSLRYFIVESLRSARRFLKACDRDINVDELHLVELNEHTPADKVSAMLEPMVQGHSMGVVSDAGCPAVADPGADAVAIAQQRGYRVVPLVGPSSIIMSVMASGFNGQSFAFNGYLPINAVQRAAKLKEMEHRIRRERQTQIFIEAPYRNNKLIQWLCTTLSADMQLCVASDVTGPRESIITLPIQQWRRRDYDYDKIPTIYLIYN